MLQIGGEQRWQESAGWAGKDCVAIDNSVELLEQILLPVQILWNAFLYENGTLGQLLDVIGAGDAAKLFNSIQFATQQTLLLQLDQLLFGSLQCTLHLFGQNVVEHHLVAHGGE